MTSTPTAATPAPEELAARVGWPHESGMRLCGEKDIAAAIRQHSEAQRAEIERLTTERDDAREGEQEEIANAAVAWSQSEKDAAALHVVSHDRDGWKARATTAEAALAAMTAERDCALAQTQWIRGLLDDALGPIVAWAAHYSHALGRTDLHPTHAAIIDGIKAALDGVPAEGAIATLRAERDKALTGAADPSTLLGDIAEALGVANDSDEILAALSASLERERELREALRKCISPYAGYAIQNDSQAVDVMKGFYAHIREVDGIARAALAKEATDGR